MRAIFTILAIILGIVFFPVLVIFFIVAIPFLLCWWCIKAILSDGNNHCGRNAPDQVAEIRLIQEINRNLNRMEDRIETLETIVTRPIHREPAFR